MMDEHKKGRAHNPEKTRETILIAATELFAEHGFQGASINDIAQAAGYTKSMIFHYFNDKLGLYTAVVERMAMQILPADTVAIVSALLADETTPRDPHKLRTLIATVIGGNFDILRANPKAQRLFMWEAAEKWHTTRAIFSKFPAPSGNRFAQIISEAQAAGLLQPGITFAVLFTFVQDSGLFYLTMLPRLQLMLRNENLTTDEALIKARDEIIQLILNGLMRTSSKTPTLQDHL